MKHKLTKLILMAVFSTSASSFAAEIGETSGSLSGDQQVRDLNEFIQSDLIQCSSAPTCKGESLACGQQTTLASCMDQSKTDACYWTCD